MVDGMKNSAKIQIMVIEDNNLLREGITVMLNNHCDFEVVARSQDGDAVRQLKRMDQAPHVILLDLGLEKVNSLKLMASLKKELSATKIIAMDILPNHVDIIEFVNAGGAGFILKNAPFNDWIKTIKAVAAGKNIMPPALTQSLFAEIVELVLKDREGMSADSIQFTDRERQVVNLIAEGLSNKEIAEKLFIATYTVKSHVHNILEKMELSTRLQVAAFVRKEGPV